jgi:hypothetical protein
MSRLKAEVAEQLASKELFPVWFFEFTDGEYYYRYCSLDVPLFTTDTDGPSGYFVPRNFDFESLEYTLSNVMDTAVLTVDNGDRILTSIFVDGIIEEQPASLYLGLLDATGDYIGGVKLFEGEVDDWELDENEVRITIGSIFSRWSQSSGGKHSASCRWKVFKGTECAYSGSGEWCDRTYNRCVQLENSANFGGFRFLPSLENTTIWWGPTPKQRMDD